MPSTESLFTPFVISSMQSAIADCGGNEVFFAATGASPELLDEVRVLARGNEVSVPAILPVLRPGDVVIHNHPSGVLQPSEADIGIASYLGNQRIGSFIIDNAAENAYIIVERIVPEEKAPLDGENLGALLGDQSPLAGTLQQYEFRPSQIDMLQAVSDAFNNDQVAVIEAGTGTGKTLAYLIPAIRWALDNDERVVVSTHTITLQEQILGKDIPLLRRALTDEFRAVLVKGRGNYLCKRKAAAEQREMLGMAFTKEEEELQGLMEWAGKTATGDRSELPFEPTMDNWEKLNCEADACTHIKCEFYRDCHLVKARREAATAHLLIVNHHLLFADLALRHEAGNFNDVSVLPPYQRIILDEAHHVEDVATGYFGSQLTRAGLRRMIGRVSSGGREMKGALTKMTNVLVRYNKGPRMSQVTPLMEEIEQTLMPRRDALFERSGQVFDEIAAFAGRQRGETNGETRFRIRDETLESEQWHDRVLKPVDELAAEMKTFIKSLRDFRKHTENVDTQVDGEIDDYRIELSAAANRLEGACEVLQQFVRRSEEERVRWVETREYRGTPLVGIHQAPLVVAGKLAHVLYDNFPTVIYTSATLTVDNAFDYFGRRTGLDSLPADRLITRQLPSPFNYEEQVLVATPTDMPAPTEPDFQKISCNLIRRSIKVSRGRAFVLFTSYRAMDETYESLYEELAAQGFTPLKQGTEPRTRLLQKFRNDPASVLFAAASFWEGVDVEGEALESIIITRLPFRVPTEPIIEARVEAIEKNGGDAFREYSLPDAVIRFRQGFGRLIRRKTDRGTVLILDSRITTKPYGRVFLRSLPPCRVIKSVSQTVLEELKKFQ